MKISLIFLFLLCVSFIHGSRKLKILVNSPNVGYSHLQFQGKLADALVDAGHEVHVLVPMWNEQEFRNGTKTANKVVRYSTETPTLYHEIHWVTTPFDCNKMDPKFLNKMLNFTGQFCKEMANDVHFVQQMAAEKYDVGISEGLDACIFGIFEAAGIPTKLLSSALPIPEGISDIMGLPLPRSYVPFTFMAPESSPYMGFLDRLQNWYAHMMELYYFFRRLVKNDNQFLSDAFGRHFAPLKSIIRETHYVFVNTPPLLDHVKPTTGKIAHIGGIALTERGELDEEIDRIFSMANKGVVLFSFGSLTDTDRMPDSLKMAFLNAFAKFPQYDFIWKYKKNRNDTKLFSKYLNVHTFEWVQQTSILARPKTKAFITHGGLNSMTEAVHSGVPMIVIPLFGDQSYNAALVASKGIGIHMPISKITEESLAVSLHEMLETNKHQNASLRLRSQLESLLYKPTEHFVKMVEHAVNQKYSNFSTLKGSQMNCLSYFHLDAVIILILLTFIVSC